MMFKLILTVIAPLISLFIIVLGNGLFNTLVAVRLELDGASNWVIGAVSAAFYGGVVLGSFLAGSFVARVGHIRSFATFAAITAVVSIIPGLFNDGYLWILLRFINGYSIAGLYIVVESWLLASATLKNRGKILAIYMTALYAGQGAGQFLLNLSNPETLTLFCLVGILSCLSIIPVCITYRASPPIEESTSLSVTKLYQITPTGTIGCFTSGLVLGAVYGLLPLFTSQFQFTLQEISFTMGMTIFGGMLLQYPVGHLSDLFNRRHALLFITIATLILSVLMMISAFFSHTLFIGLAFIFGGFAFTLYPLSLSYACDYIDNKKIVAATSGLLLAYGIGATLGPLVAPAFINFLGPIGLFIYFCVITALFATVIIWGYRRTAVSHNEQQLFVAVPHTTPIANELDPRS